MTTIHDQMLEDAAAVLDEIGTSWIFDFGIERREVQGRFADGFQQSMVGEVGAAGSQPTLLVMTARIADRIAPGELDEPGTVVTGNGTRYRVTHHKPDGAGKSVLLLTEDK